LTKKTVSKKRKTGKNTVTKSDDKGIAKKSRLRLIVVAIVVICLIGSVLLVINTGFFGSEEAKAQLTFVSGNIVQVKHTGGSWTDAENEMDLYESDSVKTGDSSAATIILFKGSIIRLDSNTEITLKEIIEGEETSVKIEQDAGRTWSTIQKISGIDNYEVETPTTVASVRGTSFDVNVTEDGITIVSVIKGSVNVSTTGEGTVYTVTLGQNYSITVGPGGMGEEEELIVDDWILNNLLNDETFTEDLKAIIYENIEPYMDDLKNRIGMTDEEIEILIEGYIRGDFAIPPETPEEYKELFELP